MVFNFMPREENFFDFLSAQAANLTKAADFFRMAISDGKLEEDEVKSIRALEHEGDTLAHEITDMLNRTFITPIDREDIFSLANTLDDVLDILNAMAGRMKLYKLDPRDKYFVEFIDLISQSAASISAAVSIMPDSRNQEKVRQHCIEINRLENLGDILREKSVGRLLAEETDVITIIKWKEIYEAAESALDRCEAVAKLIGSILVKNG